MTVPRERPCIHDDLRSRQLPCLRHNPKALAATATAEGSPERNVDICHVSKGTGCLRLELDFDLPQGADKEIKRVSEHRNCMLALILLVGCNECKERADIRLYLVGVQNSNDLV
jgi:hypothetical protein